MNLNCFRISLFICLIFAKSSAAQMVDKVNTCAACHGNNGITNNGDWPNLAGQHASYLIKQLHDYQENKTRQDPTMYAFVNNLTSKDIEYIAKYYAVLKKPTCNQKTNDLIRGAEIYQRGDMKKHITACIACHGPHGEGNAQAMFPLLAGQNSNYTISQLKAFKNGRRHNDLNGIMHDISKHMHKDDIQAVAEYICNLQG